MCQALPKALRAVSLLSLHCESLCPHLASSGADLRLKGLGWWRCAVGGPNRRLLPWAAAPPLLWPVYLSLPEVCARLPWARLTAEQAGQGTNIWENSRNSVGPGVGLEDAQLGVSGPGSCPGVFCCLEPSWLPLGQERGLSVSTQVWAGLLLRKRRSRWKGGVVEVHNVIKMINIRNHTSCPLSKK